MRHITYFFILFFSLQLSTMQAQSFFAPVIKKAGTAAAPAVPSKKFNIPPPPIPPEELEIEPAPEAEEMFEFVEVAALFPGISRLRGPYSYRKEMSDKELNKYITKNLVYPAVSMEMGIEGTVYISFIVHTNGRVVDVYVLRNSANHEPLEREAMRVIEAMNNLQEKWTPAQQNGKAKASKIVLPIKFKMNN